MNESQIPTQVHCGTPPENMPIRMRSAQKATPQVPSSDGGGWWAVMLALIGAVLAISRAA